MPSVAFARKKEAWTVRGEPRRPGPEGELVLAPEDLEFVRASDLRAALASERAFYDSHTAIAHVSEMPAAYLDVDGPYRMTDFELVGDRLTLATTIYTDWPAGGDTTALGDHFSRLLTPIVRRRRAALDSVDVDEWQSTPTLLAVSIRIAGSWRGQTAADLMGLADDVIRVCEAFAAGDVARDTAADLVRGGGAHLLVGQAEGSWLDAKAEEYDLTGTRGKISLAQAVARFANAEYGGLIIIGAKAKKVPGGEIIREIAGVVPRHADTASRYLRVLDQHLYPPALALRIELVPAAGGRSVILIDVPPQAEELKPFLVHGAITVDGDTEGAFVSIVQRRGEGSIPITAPMIHASLAAGRALLRGEWRDGQPSHRV